MKKRIGVFSWNNPPGNGYSVLYVVLGLKVHYPKLPEGGWAPKLRYSRSGKEGILVIAINEVCAAVEALLAVKNWEGVQHFKCRATSTEQKR